MPFTWVYPAAPGDYVQSEEIQEVRTNSNTLATNIFDPTPASSESISFLQPLADGIVVQNPVGDELQENLDVLKSENYCRGHHNARHISNNASDRVAIHNLECSDLATGGNISDNTDYRIARHTSYQISDHGDKNTARNGTYHRDYDSSKR